MPQCPQEDAPLGPPPAASAEIPALLDEPVGDPATSVHTPSSSLAQPEDTGLPSLAAPVGAPNPVHPPSGLLIHPPIATADVTPSPLVVDCASQPLTSDDEALPPNPVTPPPPVEMHTSPTSVGAPPPPVHPPSDTSACSGSACGLPCPQEELDVEATLPPTLPPPQVLDEQCSVDSPSSLSAPVTPTPVHHSATIFSGSPGSFSMVTPHAHNGSTLQPRPSPTPRWVNGRLNPARRLPSASLGTAPLNNSTPLIPCPPKSHFVPYKPSIMPPLPAPKLRPKHSMHAFRAPASLQADVSGQPVSAPSYMRAIAFQSFTLPSAAKPADRLSMYAAMEAARDRLASRWVLAIVSLGSASALFVEASASSDRDFFIARVVLVNAPSTLQRYLDMWSAWCDYCNIRASPCSDPLPGVLSDWFRGYHAV